MRASLFKPALTWSLRLAAGLFFCLPLVWIGAASLHPPGVPLPARLGALPALPSLENYSRLWEIFPLGRYAFNSLWISLLGTGLTLISASGVAFAVSQQPQKVQRAWVIGLLLLLLLPEFALAPARFLIYRGLGWLDTPLALVAPALIGTSPFFILIYYRAFRRIPAEIFDSARLDGAGPGQSWARVALPAAFPSSVGVGLLCFVLYWGDTTSPLLYLSSPRYMTLAVGLQSLQVLARSDWGLLMAGVMAALLLPAGLLLGLAPYFNRHGGRGESLG
jgi:multiple sugar transport system permease protein